jgi:hypothetical protein
LALQIAQISGWRRLTIAATLTAAGVFAYFGITLILAQHAKPTEVSSSQRAELPRYTPTTPEWTSLTVEPVSARVFRAEHVTEGKIAVINEDSSTPIFSPYAGRVIKLLVKPAPCSTLEGGSSSGCWVARRLCGRSRPTRSSRKCRPSAHGSLVISTLNPRAVVVSTILAATAVQKLSRTGMEDAKTAYSSPEYKEARKNR